MDTNKTIERILVGTDFTESSSRAVKRAAMLAAEHEASLQIVHVATSVAWSAFKRLGIDGDEEVEPGPELQLQLDEAVALASSHGANPTVSVTRGGTAFQLVHEAEKIGADLLVVGAHGQHSIMSGFVGTTAEQLIQRFGGDVLMVRTVPEASYDRILVAVALGPKSRFVVQSAVALSAVAKIHVAHAFEPPPDPNEVSLDTDTKSVANYHRNTRQQAAMRLSELLEQSDVPAERHLETILRQGKPTDVIQNAAAQLEVGVIAVGRNQSVLEQLFLGSATSDLVRTTSSDILVSAAH